MINEYKYGKIYWDVDSGNYYEFSTCEETRAWGKKHYKKWAKQYERVMQCKRLIR